jgi:hypothetical protein
LDIEGEKAKGEMASVFFAISPSRLSTKENFKFFLILLVFSKQRINIAMSAVRAISIASSLDRIVEVAPF